MGDTQIHPDDNATEFGAPDLTRLTERFFQAFRAGKRPRIEDFLEQAPPAQRETLVARLLKIELEPNEVGDTVDPKLLKQRFPQYADLIERLLRKRIGDYELLEFIGRGGMGQVWKATHVEMGRTVAVKLIDDHSRDMSQAIARFKNEWRTIANLKHPNIVIAWDAGLKDGVYMLAMEYVNGESLDKFVKDGRQMPVAESCELVRQAATGLQHAYARGVIHRDIKPANLMLERESGLLKILDFGLARIHVTTPGDESEGLTNGYVGTANYMSPEQWRDASRVTTQADIYSLGCTFFHLLAGRAPYSQIKNLYDLTSAHMEQAIPRPSELRSDIDPALSDIVTRMLAKSPEDRYATPSEVATALEPFAAGADLVALSRNLPAGNGCDSISGTGTARGGSHTQRNTPTAQRSATTQHWSPGKVGRKITRRQWLVGAGALASAAVLTTIYRWPNTQKHVDLMRSLGTAPGLNGDWWFNEIPIFIPPIRQLWLESLSGVETESSPAHAKLNLPANELAAMFASSDNKTLHEWLRENCPKHLGIDGDHYRHVCQRVDSTNIDRNKQQTQLNKVAKELAVRKSPPALLAADLHFRANVLHKIALNADYINPEETFLTRSEAWLEAEKSYADAIAQYKTDIGVAPEPLPKKLLLALCQADVGAMHADRYEYDDSQEMFLNALTNLGERDSSPFFGVHAHCMRAYAYSIQTIYQDAVRCLAKAEVFANQLPKGHPLRAALLEHTAWNLIEEGRDADKVEEYFERAIDIRKPLADDYRQNVYRFHNQMGQGLALHWSHNAALQEKSRQHFAGLLTGIDKELEKYHRAPNAFTPQYQLDLLERWVNAQMREADCYLFGLQPDFVQAAERYQHGVKFTRDNDLENSRLLSYVVQMRLSRALALRLAQPSSSESSTEVVQEVQDAAELLLKTPEAEQAAYKLFALSAQALGGPDEEKRVTAAYEVEQFIKTKRMKSASRNKEGFGYLERDERQLRQLLDAHRQWLAEDARKINLDP